jgi:hypothetical protein
VLAPLTAPARVECLEVGAIVSDQYSTLVGCVAELFFVGYPSVATPDLVDRYDLHPTRAQSFGDALAHVLVQQETQAHPV